MRNVVIATPLEPRGSGGDSFIMRVLRGLRRGLSENGCTVTFVPCGNSAEFRAAEHVLRDAGALAVVGPAVPALLRAVRRTGKPAVLLDTPGAHEHGFDSVVVDNPGLAHLAVSRVTALGHRRILYYGMGAHDPDNDAMRLAGYRAALKDARIRFSSRLVVSPKGRAPSQEIAAGLKKTRATGLFLANSGFYSSALRALEQLNFTTPHDVSIVCFGSPQGEPKPAGITMRVEELGMRAAARLMERIQDAGLPPEEIVVPGHFVEGDTLGSPRRPGKGA